MVERNMPGIPGYKLSRGTVDQLFPSLLDPLALLVLAIALFALPSWLAPEFEGLLEEENVDPNACLSEMLGLSQGTVDNIDHDEPSVATDRLAELVLALDEWIRKGGAVPDRWLAGRPGR